MATRMGIRQPAFPPALEATLFGWEDAGGFLLSGISLKSLLSTPGTGGEGRFCCKGHSI